jgi:hypothetical protein
MSVVNCACCNSSAYGTPQQELQPIINCTYCNKPIPGIHPYSYKPNNTLFGITSDHLYFGVELEIDFKVQNYNPHVVSCLNKLHTISKHLFYFKQDCDIYNGFEIVTQPCSFTFHKKNFPWKSICTLLQQHRALSPPTLGLHVHLSRHALSMQEEKIVRLFIHSMKKYILKFSRRRYLYACPFIDFQSKDNYCEQLFTGNTDETAVICEGNPTPTLEVRLWKATTKYEQILAAIEFCHSVCKFAKKFNKTLSLEQYNNLVPFFLTNKAKIWKKFDAFTLSSSKYPNLRKELFK